MPGERPCRILRIQPMLFDDRGEDLYELVLRNAREFCN
jgi:hypothetical protein